MKCLVAFLLVFLINYSNCDHVRVDACDYTCPPVDNNVGNAQLRDCCRRWLRHLGGDSSSSACFTGSAHCWSNNNKNLKK